MIFPPPPLILVLVTTLTRLSLTPTGVLEIELWKLSDAQTAGQAPKDML